MYNINDFDYNSIKWKHEREKVLAHWNGTCEKCGKYTNNPHVHHKYGTEFEIYEILCSHCHALIHNNPLLEHHRKMIDVVIIKALRITNKAYNFLFLADIFTQPNDIETAESFKFTILSKSNVSLSIWIPKYETEFDDDEYKYYDDLDDLEYELLSDTNDYHIIKIPYRLYREKYNCGVHLKTKNEYYAEQSKNKEIERKIKENASEILKHRGLHKYLNH